jgi:glycosyltransferase involved in cell wall biosynthesis
VIHAVPGHHQIEPCILALLFAEAYDVAVVSSEQAKIALDTTMGAAAELLQSTGGAKRKELRTVHIPLCTDTDFIRDRDRAYRRELLDVTPDDIVLLYLGRLSATYKADLEPLLRVFQQLQEESPKLKLIIAGRDDEEPYSPELLRLASGLGIRNRVMVMANFPFSLKPALLAAADIFVSPVDNIQESFGLSVIEAMAAGLPIVASDWSGYRDLIIHGETGLLVETLWDAESSRSISGIAAQLQGGVAESLLSRITVVNPRALFQSLRSLVADPDLRRRLGGAGRRRAEQLFSMKVIARQYEALWNDQWSIVEREVGTDRIRSGVKIDFNAVFGHYASHHIVDGMALRCSRLGFDLLSTSDVGLQNVPQEFGDHDFRKALTTCINHARPLGEICERSGLSRRALVWLFKKGFLEIDCREHVGCSHS